MPWNLGPGLDTVAGAAYSQVHRQPTGDEEPLQGWLDCYDPDADAGVGCTTGHLHGYDVTGATVRLTVLRNPLAGDHGGGWATDAGESFRFTDSGPHDARIRIDPHRGDWRAAGLVGRAAEQARPPVVVVDTYHPGRLAQRGSFLRLEPEGAPVLRAVKRAESDDGVVLRLVECTGTSATVVCSGDLIGRSVEAHLQPYEVRTLLVPDDLTLPPRDVGLTELETQSRGGGRVGDDQP